MSNDQIAAVIAANNKGEQGAIEDYFRLLDESKRAGLPKEFIAQLEEIISDEMQHSEVLAKWVTKLTGIKPNVN